jgi:hypothetical protein
MNYKIKNEKFNEIDILIKNELDRANKMFCLFNSRHQAYGVMKEEFEELIDEIKDIEIGINTDYWNLCKNDNEEIGDLLLHLECGIKNAIIEMIQLGAMIEKTKILEGCK